MSRQQPGNHFKKRWVMDFSRWQNVWKATQRRLHLHRPTTGKTGQIHFFRPRNIEREHASPRRFSGQMSVTSRGKLVSHFSASWYLQNSLPSDDRTVTRKRLSCCFCYCDTTQSSRTRRAVYFWLRLSADLFQAHFLRGRGRKQKLGTAAPPSPWPATCLAYSSCRIVGDAPVTSRGRCRMRSWLSCSCFWLRISCILHRLTDL